jgi:hypothetical protein
MAPTARTLSIDSLLATTMDYYRPKMEDNVHTANPFFYWLTRNDKKKKQDGGANILVPVRYGKNTTVGSYSGYDNIDVSPQDGHTIAVYPWRQIAGSISIARIEERKNSGRSKVISLLQSKIEQAEESMKEEFNRLSFLDGTGNGGKDIFGLNLLVEDGGTWLSDVAGISRLAESWWRNKWVSMTGQSFATTGLNFMRTMYNDCSKGNIHPDLILTTQTVYEYYEKLLAANERFIDTRSGDAGFQNLLFKASVMMYDTYVPSQAMFFLTSDYIEWYVDTETDFITTPFERPSNQDAKVSQILVYGNVTMSNCARQGRIGIIDTA